MIVPAVNEDLQFCLTMDEIYFKRYIEEVDGAYDSKIWFQYLTKDLPRTFMLKENNHNIGYYRYSIMDDQKGQYAYLRIIALKADYQKKNHGKLLYDHFEKRITDELKLDRIKLSCPKYLPSIKWYSLLGYNETEDTKFYKRFEKTLVNQ